MEHGIHVEYETGHGQSSYGCVQSFNEETEILTVRDDVDGTIWRGPAERATPTGQSACDMHTCLPTNF